MSITTLPSIVERIKAMLADGIFIVCMMFLVTSLFENMENIKEAPRMFVFLFLFVVYDPLFTMFGGTIGHRIVGLRVKRENNIKKNVSPPAAFVRFVFKFVLGWVSLITVTSNSKSKAIHDFIAGSIVVYKHPKHQPEIFIDKVVLKSENPEVLDT